MRATAAITIVAMAIALVFIVTSSKDLFTESRDRIVLEQVEEDPYSVVPNDVQAALNANANEGPPIEVQLGLEDNKPSKEEAEVAAIMGSATGLKTDDTKTTLQSVFAPLHGSNDFGSELSLMQVFEEDEEEGPVVVATPNQAMQAGAKKKAAAAKAPKKKAAAKKKKKAPAKKKKPAPKKPATPKVCIQDAMTKLQDAKASAQAAARA